MPTNYPTSIDSYSARTNNVDTINAGDVNDARDAIVAIETKLGTSTQQISAPVGVAVPRSNGTAVFALDSSASVTIAVNNDAIATPFGNANNFAGIIIVNDIADGDTAVFVTGGNGTVLIASTLGGYSATINTANKTNVYIGTGVVGLQNKRGTNRTYCVTGIRTRSTN